MNASGLRRAEGICGINPWLLAEPAPEPCRSGTYRLEFCRWDIYQSERSGRRAADEADPRQPPLPPKPKRQHPQLRISAFNSPLKLPTTPLPTLNLAGRSTHATNRRPNWLSRD